MCLLSFCTDFLLPNKLCSSFTKPLLIPTAISMITETPSPHLDVFPALPKTIDVTTASLKAFLTSPATLISATNHSAIHSVSMFAITNHPFHVSMPHLFIRFWSLIWQGLKLISKFWKNYASQKSGGSIKNKFILSHFMYFFTPHSTSKLKSNKLCFIHVKFMSTTLNFKGQISTLMWLAQTLHKNKWGK